MVEPNQRPNGGRDRVALVIAIAVGVAVNLIIAGVLWGTLVDPTTALSENSTHILTVALVGCLFLIAGYLGNWINKRNGR